MLAEVRPQNQITLPSKIAKSLDIKEGDMLDVTVVDGGIYLNPVVVYPRTELERIAKHLRDYENSPEIVYDSMEAMFRNVGIIVDSKEE